MKQLKKQVLLVLCMIACLFALTACGKAEESSSLSDSESTTLQSSAKDMMEQFMIVGDTMGELAVQQYREGGMEVFAAAMEGYLGAKEDLGAYVSVKDGLADKDDDGFSIILNVVFEKRECTFTISMNDRMQEVTAMSFDPVYTTQENMVKAVLNTLMGMGTVFIVLIFISWLISCFRYVRRFEDKMKKTPASAPVITRAASSPAPAAAVQEDLTDDLELVAVITAAVAAYTGTSSDGLVVRSIRRAPGSKWKKA